LAKQSQEDVLAVIEEMVRHQGRAVSAQEILHALSITRTPRALQYRLQRLIDEQRLLREGTGRWAKYRLPDVLPQGKERTKTDIPISPEGEAIRLYVRQAPEKRKPVGYDRNFLDRYQPNRSFYLTETERAHLREVGQQPIADQPAGTYARNILNRLLIDLSWNSSRLEGNTYSLLDTKRLIDLGQEAEGRQPLEAQMILNHKEAIEFLVSAADTIGFNRMTLLNLHALLANNLLGNLQAAGRLRHIAVGIEGSVFHPLEVPQLIEERFHQILGIATAISDPFEQSLFAMVQLPYLQPFDDVNKRVSRLAANIPFIKGNLAPLSFAEVPRETYTEAIVGVYELTQTDLLKDLFIWAYERSAVRYAAIRQSLGQPDPFRLRYRDPLRALVSTLVRGLVPRKEVIATIAQWAEREIPTEDRARFAELAETELLSLHEGNFARYRLLPSEFAAWEKVWGERP